MQLTCTGVKLIKFVKKLIFKKNVVGEKIAIFYIENYRAHIFGVYNRHFIWKQKKNSDLKNNLGKRNADVLINIKK